MKLSISITLVYLFGNYVVFGDHAVLRGEGHHPTHIIKLKTLHNNTDSAFEPTVFIHQHYTEFQQRRRKPDRLASVTARDEVVILDQIHVSQSFSAVVGSFHPSFADYLHELDAVEYVEPNHIYKIAGWRKNVQDNVPSWGLARVSQRKNADLSKYIGDDLAGNGVHVYIFDTGINVQHPDFEGRAVMEPSFVGYEDNNDYSGHGTHVAGTIGGKTYGIAKSAILHGVKILDENGDGSIVGMMRAISHVIHVATPGKTIINLSLSGPRSQAMDDALTAAAEEHRIPIIASAGNTGDDACAYSPSANPNVFSVGASDYRDRVASFSSYGKCVRLYAPGANITSSWLKDSSMTMDGTSMANPHVSGIAALLMAKYDFRTVHEVYDALTAIATPDILSNVQGSRNLLAYTGVDLV
ncbi:subtilisin-like serine protease [Apophysomyces ossiformis]|uniref:Subtilisin-like serine protease n=1 Tax=Apophysomyces ossiformis TaxID=679940 RepID=A0A8H7ENG2_9FUNG|nr:subtilisin-like serine protease [Apophysomyces ossiformis]